MRRAGVEPASGLHRRPCKRPRRSHPATGTEGSPNAAARLGKLPRDDADFAYVPTLTHSDVALDHLLITGSKISGIIDFGDVAISDPDYDLSFLWAEAGSAFVQRVQQFRGEPLHRRLTSKLQFWALADPANDVLHAIENDMPEFQDRSMRLLHDRICAHQASLTTLS
jgi:aminoglycoside 2''-phosphotransferase